LKKSRLSWHKQSRLIELFVAGSTARTAAHLVNVNKSTASYYFLRLRELIYTHCEALEMFDGEVAPEAGFAQVDESYFGGRRKGKRGRGALGKVPVVDLLKPNGKVCTIIIPNAKTNTLLPIIWQKVKLTNSIYLKLHCSAHLQVSQITIQCVSCRFFGNPYSLPICALESTQVASSLYYY